MSRSQQGWWLVTIVARETSVIIKKNIDAVFACDSAEAMELATQRNPIRPGQIFGLRKITPYERKTAISLNERRTEQIAEIYEIMRMVGG